MTPAARALALACCAVSAGSPAGSKDPWLRMQSAHFELFTTTGEQTGRGLLAHFEMVRGFFQQVFELTGRKPVRIVAFRDAKEFAPYRPNEVAAAFYHPGERHDYIVMRQVGAGQYQMATHEYTHLLIGQTGSDIPVWLNEGMADLYSTLEQAGSRMVVGAIPEGRAGALVNEPWIPLRELVSAGHDSALYNNKSHAGMFYAESWALFHMLFLEKSYKLQLRAMIDALAAGDTAAAFQKAYGKTVEQVESDLHRYIRSPYLTAVALAVQLPKTPDAEMEKGAEFPARLALAELVSEEPGRTAQARAAYEQLSREYAGRWELEAAWGRFFLAERRNEESLAHLARAIKLHGGDADLLVDYARALLLGRRMEDAEAALRSALKADDHLQRAHYDLGLLLLRTGGWSDAIVELRAATPVSQQQASRFFYGMAYAEYRMGDLVRARAYIEQGRPHTKIAEESAALEKLAQSVGPPVVEGVLESVECVESGVRVHVRSSDREHVFGTPSLADVQGLECGAKPGVKVRITYQIVTTENKAGLDGVVRSMEFLR